jgi:hypothetical protein
MNSKIYAALVAASLTVTSAAALAQAPMEVTHDPAAVQAGAYDVEPLHTRVLFSVSHLGTASSPTYRARLPSTRRSRPPARWKFISRSPPSRPPTRSWTAN